MAVAEGDTVIVHYKGSLENGQVFDTSEGRDPLQFEVGAQQVIPGFEKAVVGKEVGETAQVTIPPEEGYGEPDPSQVRAFPKEQLGTEVEEGQVLGLENEQGQQFQAQVVGVKEDEVTLDFNHFLAGKTLIFDIEVVGVE